VQTCTDVKHADGGTAFHAFDDCMAGSCGEECALGADWSCLGQVNVAVPAADQITASLTALEATAQAVPIPGLEVVACASTDPTCLTPLTTTQFTDDAGTVSLAIPTTMQSGRQPFNGFVQLTDPSGTYVTELGFQGPSTTQNGAASKIIVFNLGQAQLAAASLGTTYDPSKAAVLMTATDCANRPALGVTFDANVNGASTLVFYTRSQLVSKTATATDSSGTALTGFVSPGTVEIVVRSGDPTPRTIADVPVLTRAGAVTVVRVAPTL
jgi:hypothetical protein